MLPWLLSPLLSGCSLEYIGRLSATPNEARNIGASSLAKVADLGTTTIRNGGIAVGSVYYSEGLGQEGGELWRTDGTPEGTYLVKDILPGTLTNGTPSSSSPQNFTEVNGIVFFTAQDANTGVELWKTDGTEAGTVRVKDINPGADSSNPSELTSFQGRLYFSAEDQGSNSAELWQSDGTEVGTVKLKDIYPGSTGSKPHDFFQWRGLLYFSAHVDATYNYRTLLWQSDGTSGGTTPAPDFLSTCLPEFLGDPTVIFQDSLICLKMDSTGTSELWKSDGTASGTILLKAGLLSTLTHFKSAGNLLYFTTGSEEFGHELWKTDGTPGGTALIDIVPGPGSSYPTLLADLNGILIFAAWDPTHGNELWRSDGTKEGTRIILDISPGAIPGIYCSFGALGHIDYGCIKNFVVSQGHLWFSAIDRVHGVELWRSDGTAQGTVLVQDIVPGFDGSNPIFMKLGETLLFSTASAGSGKNGLWRVP
ncbi:MAG: hypothetical protein NDJ89_04205 [Oligoflexia bacterium]|nr:hypothetical protein [Oligoflexia bacterium]